jgi:radical SAM superfamily enzyme with C-terminal helix-hairpin-helix motif
MRRLNIREIIIFSETRPIKEGSKKAREPWDKN